VDERAADHDQSLGPLLSRRKDLASLRWHLRQDEKEDPEQAEELDGFLSKLLEADEELKSTSKEIWRLRRFDREDKFQSLKQVRRDLSEMAFDDFSARWMTRSSATVDYWLEVALDIEGVLYAFSNPVFGATRLTLDSFLEPRAAAIAAAIVRGIGVLLCLAAASVILYFGSGTSYWWIGWLVAAYCGWLIYRRAQRADKLERDADRHTANLSVIDACVNEVRSGHFDASEIARRLRDQEKNGLFVHTTIFTVLGRSASLHQATDARYASAGESTKPTQEENEHWAFQRASTLTFSELRAMKPGEILRLIERSWFYPSDKAAFARFEYKHNRVSEKNSSKFEYEVHGFRRFPGAEDWEPYQFLASEKESSTSSCAGTIKRLD
jgi:hypothetical protein